MASCANWEILFLKWVFHRGVSAVIVQHQWQVSRMRGVAEAQVLRAPPHAACVEGL